MPNNLFFSIIIPVYNRAHLIEKTISTVLQQVYCNFEVIVIDDGSQDNTAEVIQSIQDPRLRYYYQENSERAVARNHGIRRAQGDYITFLDSDDIIYQYYLQEAAHLISSENFPPFVHTSYEIKNVQGKTIDSINNRKGDLNKAMLYGNSLSCIGVFVRRDILLEHSFNEDRALSGSEDYELWLRLACRYDLLYSNNVTSALIQHEQRSVLGFEKEQLVKRVLSLIEYVIQDHAFQKKFGKQKNTFIAHRYLYLALHLVIAKETFSGIKYWIKAIIYLPSVLFHIKTLGIIKNILLNFKNIF